jgi:uncharacterized protein YdeI (YjbR/CyaY-like superfamily)
MKAEYQIEEFRNSARWRQWLAEHHEDTDGIWVRMYKKASGIGSITHAEALDEALCFGWIDGQRKAYDELSFLQKFTPRRARSLWSKRNIEHVTRLAEGGLMAPAGLAEVQRAQEDGRWDAAYDAQSEMVIPDYFLTELAKNPKAEAFFETLNKTNKFAIAWRLATATSEDTRKRRLEKLLVMLDAGEKIH